MPVAAAAGAGAAAGADAGAAAGAGVGAGDVEFSAAAAGVAPALALGFASATDGGVLESAAAPADGSWGESSVENRVACEATSVPATGTCSKAAGRDACEPVADLVSNGGTPCTRCGEDDGAGTALVDDGEQLVRPQQDCAPGEDVLRLLDGAAPGAAGGSAASPDGAGASTANLWDGMWASCALVPFEAPAPARAAGNLGGTVDGGGRGGANPKLGSGNGGAAAAPACLVVGFGSSMRGTPLYLAWYSRSCTATGTP